MADKDLVNEKKLSETIPSDPATDGSYVLQNDVSSGTATKSWASGGTKLYKHKVIYESTNGYSFTVITTSATSIAGTRTGWYLSFWIDNNALIVQKWGMFGDELTNFFFVNIVGDGYIYTVNSSSVSSEKELDFITKYTVTDTITEL